MPGFGSGPFGRGPFGRFNWGRQVLFLDMPQIDRDLDALPEQNNRLEKWSESIRQSFDFLLKKAVDFGDLRDPDFVPSRFDAVIPVTIQSVATNEETGKTLNVTLFAPDPTDPFNPLGDATVGWILEDSTGRTFTVNSVCKLDADGNVAPVVEVFGIADDPLPGAATLRAPSLIQELGADFGIDVDQNEPESFQRSSVRNAVQWLDLKGTQKSYDIIGKIAGYRVEAVGLWRLPDPIPLQFSGDQIFELPLGSGNFYTDQAPERPRFDEVTADSIPLDTYCFEEVEWSTEYPAGPPLPLPPDGTTVEEAIGIPFRGITINSSSYLGDDVWELSVLGTIDDVMVIDEAVGNWLVRFPLGDAGDYFIESIPQEIAPGEWQFTIVAPDTLTMGAEVDLHYDCVIDVSCEVCRASVVRVNITPAEVLTDPDALLDGVLGRLTTKILQVVPAHVRLTQISLNIGPIQAAFNIQATILPVSVVPLVAQVGFYYDLTPADDLITDPDHLVASITAFTVP